MEKQLLDFLMKNQLRYISMIESLRRGNIDIISFSGENVLCYDKEFDAYYIIAENDESAEIMLNMLNPKEKHTIIPYNYATVELVKKKFNYKLYFQWFKASYLKNEDLPVDESLTILPLDISYAEFVQKHYSSAFDIEYIVERMTKGPFFGLFVEGKAVGFIGTHSVGALGILEVLPEFKGSGYGKALLSHMTNVVKNMGQTPYSHIDIDNETSLNLHMKLNYEISREKEYWLWEE